MMSGAPGRTFTDILRWMHKESHDGKWWQPGVLTPAGNRQGNPPGNLTAAEDLSIFSDLKKKDLLVSALNDRREPCFILNECKEDEWKAEIEDAVKPWYKKSRFVTKAWNNTKFIFIAFFAGLAGSYAKVLIDRICG